MKIGIGIDTGGTYTDAVAFDFESSSVLAKGKALTTKEDLTKGIGEAIDSLLSEYLPQAKIVALSTTLATNACVEGKGGRAKLVMIGASERLLEWIGADELYGLKKDDILCIDINNGEDNKDRLADLEKQLNDADAWLSDADALSVAEVDSSKNGAEGEKRSKEKFAKYDVPVVCASNLVKELNVMERGATALLNARLLPVIQEFISAVGKALAERGITAPAMIVRSDGSLMTDKLSQKRPVETIHSGPAASVLGARGLTNNQNCVIVDMGGTTTDISIIKDGVPSMIQNGIRIGGWRTQVKGVFMQTVALGGDSAIRMKEGRLEIATRKAEPLCVAASKWPGIKDELKKLIYQEKIHSYPLHEFLYLVREPKNTSRYTSNEIALCDALKNGPLMLEQAAKAIRSDIYRLDSERLESEGVVMRCGLTPTDIMHIRGDFEVYDKEASELAVKYFMNCLSSFTKKHGSVESFCEEVYDLIKHKLYDNIVNVLLADKYPDIIKNGAGEQLSSLISQCYLDSRQSSDSAFFEMSFNTSAALVGIGAPTHVFLPDVAKALGADCIIPEHAAVANAVGAVSADISAKVLVQISPNITEDGAAGYTVYGADSKYVYAEIDKATEAALEEAVRQASEEARIRGALGELSIKTKVTPKISYAAEGVEIDLGTSVEAFATGRIEM